MHEVKENFAETIAKPQKDKYVFFLIRMWVLIYVAHHNILALLKGHFTIYKTQKTIYQDKNSSTIPYGLIILDAANMFAKTETSQLA